jgi:hypothetical protein
LGAPRSLGWSAFRPEQSNLALNKVPVSHAFKI